LRRVPTDKIAAIIGLRAANAPVDSIAERVGVSRASVYNYLAKVQAFADERFIQELQRQLQIMDAIYHNNAEKLSTTEQARQLATLLSKYIYLPDEAVCQAILNANWKVLQACRKRKHST
jgi:AcrR family transcriptional regulator